MKGVIVTVEPQGLVEWESFIRPKREVLRELEATFGPTPDERFLPSSSDIPLIQDEESWAWIPRYEDGRKMVDFWFRDPKNAVLFKLKWANL